MKRALLYLLHTPSRALARLDAYAERVANPPTGPIGLCRCHERLRDGETQCPDCATRHW